MSRSTNLRHGLTQDDGKTILLLGATGQLGAELLCALTPLGQVHTPGRAQLDLTQLAAVRSTIETLRPRWIVNAAAYTAVDRAEQEAQQAFAINAEALATLGESARAVDAAVLHFSTDYVFAGSGTLAHQEMDATCPLNVYGASKLAGEIALAASGAKHLILRTSWVFDSKGQNFLRTILRLALERAEIRVVNDQFGAPTWSRDLANMAAHVIRRCDSGVGGRLGEMADEWGIYHATSQGETTWHGFAAAALERYARLHPGVPLAKLIGVPTSAYPTAAKRPLNSRLDCTRLSETFKWQMMDWREALDAVISEL